MGVSHWQAGTIGTFEHRWRRRRTVGVRARGAIRDFTAPQQMSINKNK